ncbi:hypothetical protein [Rhizobium sp. Leaf262]|uniref:hypothetical protein n=1 Tax=Rhizobium sp. Leaf262 TaxID=1736312 RepID=UPI000A7038CE|nr:hypothetical protein [Rhizobium sp. Leaf262]
MADISASNWNEQDVLNNSAAPNGLPKGAQPSAVQLVTTDTRGAVKRFWNRINSFYTTTGTTSALILTMQVAPAGYVKGERLAFFSSQSNTGAMTLNVNGLGAKSILQQDGAALAPGQIVAGSATTVIYDGAAFRLENYASNPKFSGTVSADAVSATTITGTLSGNGAGITAINASNIATGTIADTRLPATMSGKSFTTDVSINQTLSVGTTNGGGIEVGRTNGTASPAFIDFHTSATAVDYNVRLNATGDTANAGGTLDILSASLKHNGAEVWDTASLPTPAVQATQVIAGNGLTGGGTLAASRTIMLGTPGTITNATTNAVSTTSHTHALTLVAGDITGALGYAPVDTLAFTPLVTRTTSLETRATNLEGRATALESGGIKYVGRASPGGSTNFSLGGIPIDAKRVTLVFYVSTAAATAVWLRLGRAAGWQESGYEGSWSQHVSGSISGGATAADRFQFAGRGSTLHRYVVTMLRNSPSENTWFVRSEADRGSGFQWFNGSVALTGNLTSLLFSNDSNSVMNGQVDVYAE